MTRKIIVIIMLIWPAFIMQVRSQETELSEDVAGDSVVQNWGPNMKNSFFPYIGIEMIIGESEGPGAEIIYGSSISGNFGFRYKRKICNTWSTGLDLADVSYSFVLKQTIDKVFPNNDQHNKERFTLSAISLEWFNRINYGKRGNYMGRYLDIGVYGCYYAGVSHFTRDKLDVANSYNAGQVDVTYRNIGCVEPFGYGLCLRLGFNRIMITGSYRLSDIFKENYSVYPELPRYSVGLQLGLHK